MPQVEPIVFSFYQQLDSRPVCAEHANLLLRPSMVLMPRGKAGSAELRLAPARSLARRGRLARSEWPIV